MEGKRWTPPKNREPALRNRVLTGEIIIKPADKGSATVTVVMSRDDYVAEAMRQLMREEHYLLLDRDATTEYAEEIKLLAEMKARNTIDQETSHVEHQQK